ncbi:MAG TPA: regulatory iron-sulfur-containing complex subunit RicT [Gemmatimonadaceae bacterium]|nr:regulatory iron-sulfur-containing complex subunit RicT [Gemmatimonadaceae bacterium]
MASYVIEVSFKGNRREFFLWETEDVPPVHAPIIVEVDRGEDLGRVHAVGDLALKRNKGTPHGLGDAIPTRKARRLASSDDLRRHDELRSQDEEARRKAMERVRANALTMKVSDAEWQWDRKKLTFYFTAEKRVDFRTLVRELAATFRTRIELKQIGVRDEARRLDGIGRCGRQYCSASWLPELRPVSLGVAKDQRLSLNPTQISGACGRLMCSLRYEHEFYVQARRRFPKEGKTVRTGAGEERVISNDIFRERVVLRNGEGELRTIPLAQLLDETSATGATFTPAVSERRAESVGATPTAPARRIDPEDELREEIDEPRGVDLDEDAGEDAPAETSTGDASPSDATTPDGGEQRRPHRRRGRRGGRRNRGRRQGGSDTPPSSSSPPSA